ncbi:hypothetical protein [Deinococcus aetherius]|nr:hypothetical protein [Deinococcus aetherius]
MPARLSRLAWSPAFLALPAVLTPALAASGPAMTVTIPNDSL